MDICLCAFSYIKFVSASGEAILGTQRYLDDATRRDNIRDYPRTLHKHFTQALYKSTLSRHFTQALYPSTLHKHFTQALYPSTLHKHFILALYTSTLTKHFTQAPYQSTLSKHFIKVFLKHFRNTCQGITKVLRQGIKTCLLYTSPSPRDGLLSRMPSSA